MQIVKIFPNNKNKCHFSIRKNLNKFYVYEGDMVLREDLENINSAETEISLICLARQQSFVKVVPVKYVSGVVQNTIEEYAVEIKNCKQCKKKFDVVKKRGSLNQAYCSPKCRTKFNNSKRIIKDKEMFEKNKPKSEVNITFEKNPTPQEISNSMEKIITKLKTEQKKIFENNLPPKNCLICNNVFNPKKPQSVNCSQKCSTKAYVNKKRLKKKPVFTFDTKNIDAFKESIQKENLDAFHEAIEKENKNIESEKKLKHFCIDVIDYFLASCDVNSDDNFDCMNVVNEIVSYKILDISKTDILVVFEPVLDTKDDTLRLDKNYALKSNVLFQRMYKMITQNVYSGYFPSEEQLSKVFLLKIATNQLNYLIKQKQKNAPIKVESANLDWLVDMIKKLQEQNDILIEKLNASASRINNINVKLNALEGSSNQISNEILKALEKIQKDIIEISTKKRGFFS